jgi:uncharacterized repeat protein (TIGR04076 family)
MADQEFTLHDLRVETIAGERPFVCSHVVGSGFEVRGENLHFDPDKPFSMYALAAIQPLLPATPRHVDTYDWMATDHGIACPDPHCGARFRISRIGERTFSREETTAEPLPSDNRWTP